jgi:glycosyltransferase involved in cell wall biosynthesis
MVNTVEDSLNSILQQIDDQYEVIVVDAKSTDGSLEILQEFNERGDIRLIVEEGCKIGEGWNIGVEAAKGQYVMPKLDMDDRYYDGVIPDFVGLFHQLEEQLDFNFFLNGHGINICKKSLYQDVGGFKDLVVEDNDFFRRLLAQDKLIRLEHDPVCEKHGHEKGLQGLLERDYWSKYSEIRSGQSLKDMLLWHVTASNKIDGNAWKLLPWNVGALLMAWIHLHLTGETRYEFPDGLDKKYIYGEIERGSLSDIEEKYGVKLDKSKLKTDKFW